MQFLTNAFYLPYLVYRSPEAGGVTYAEDFDGPQFAIGDPDPKPVPHKPGQVFKRDTLSVTRVMRSRLVLVPLLESAHRRERQEQQKNTDPCGQ
eukprot:4159134-Amphidinium_carterae.1